jgi:hypothetical protein
VTVGGSFALFKEKLVMAWNSSSVERQCGLLGPEATFSGSTPREIFQMSPKTSEMHSSKPADNLPQTSEAGTSDELEFAAFELLQIVAECSRFVRGDVALNIRVVRGRRKLRA